MRRARLAEIGERLACDHLRAHGYAILARNWRCRQGELDIVARDADGYAFVEVKTRRGRTFGAPEEAFTPRKAARVRAAAHAWLAEHLGDQPVDWRIDLVAVELDARNVLKRITLYRFVEV
ncbi:MAG: YraN family protein [Ardenticatenia bacterium]|nr:MAG: YraN family protein [Ardenticatenia bacterium]